MHTHTYTHTHAHTHTHTHAQDEAGIAAYKTVELDGFLAGASVQHREVQNHESKQFISYFPKGIQ